MVNLTFIKVISSRTSVPFSLKIWGLWTEVSLCPPCTCPHANTLEDLLQSMKPLLLKLNPHLQKTDQVWERIILANLPGGEWGLSLCGQKTPVFSKCSEMPRALAHTSVWIISSVCSPLEASQQYSRTLKFTMQNPMMYVLHFSLTTDYAKENCLKTCLTVAAHLLSSSSWVWKKLICSLCLHSRFAVKSQSTQCTCSLQCCAWKLCGNDPKDDLECKIG